MKRMIIVAVLVLVLVAAASSLHVEGQLHAVAPQLAVAIRGSEAWYTHPTLASRADDARGVYVVLPAMPASSFRAPESARNLGGGDPHPDSSPSDAARNDVFAALRIDSVTGEQTTTSVTLDPKSPYRAFVPATVQADVHGLHFKRPAFHLLSIPTGGGPGVHRVDSATGRLDVTTEGRTLLTRNVFNSSSTPELLSLVSADPNGRWLAALARIGDGWTLFLFARNHVEES